MIEFDEHISLHLYIGIDELKSIELFAEVIWFVLALFCSNSELLSQVIWFVLSLSCSKLHTYKLSERLAQDFCFKNSIIDIFVG
jgi:hypothetical protein